MMENLKEALEYMVELGEDRVDVIEVDGVYYTNKSLSRIDENVDLDCLHISTLSGLVDYIKSNVDKEHLENLLVVVKSPTEISQSLLTYFYRVHLLKMCIEKYC